MIDDASKSKGKGGSPLALQLPPIHSVLTKTRLFAGDSARRTEAIAAAAAEDPVVALELLRAANALACTEGKPPLTTIQSAIVRLGLAVTVEKLDKLMELPQLEGAKVQECFEGARERCRRAGQVAKILAEQLSRNLVDDCLVAGLFLPLGELLAIAHLGGKYVELAAGNSRSKILYRLEKDHRFSTSSMCVSYLKRAGIPDTLLFALDPESKIQPPQGRAQIKPICAAVDEIMNAFEAGRWDKLAPGEQLPPKSALRMLQLDSRQYQEVYSLVGKFLLGAAPAAKSGS